LLDKIVTGRGVFPLDEFAFPLLVLILVEDTEAFPFEGDAAAFPLLTFLLRGIAETIDEFVNDEVSESSVIFDETRKFLNHKDNSICLECI